MYRFTINSDVKGVHVLENDPIGWEALNFVQSRDTELEGVFQIFSSDLIFILDGFDYLNDIIQQYGLQQDVYCKIEKYDNNLHYYRELTTAKFDFSGWKYDTSQGNGIKISLVSDGFTEKMLSRLNNDIKLTVRKDMDGNPINEFESSFKTVNVLGQTIYNEQVGSGHGGYNEVRYRVGSKVNYYTMPMLFENDNEYINTMYLASFDMKNDLNLRSSADCFYNSTNAGSIVDIDFTLNMYLNYYFGYGATTLGGYPVLYLYDRASDGRMIFNRYVAVALPEEKPAGYYWTVNFKVDNVELTSNQGLALLFVGFENLQDPSFTMKMQVLDNSVFNIRYRQIAEITTAKMPLIFEVLKRVTQVITGTENFKSSVFGRTDSSPAYASDGEHSLVGIANGYLFRNYTIEESQLTVNPKVLFSDLKKLCKVGFGIEDGYLIAEPIEYFYSDEVVHRVTNMEDKSFSTDVYSEIFYSKIASGKDKYNYEEIAGLLSQHVKQNYTTILKNFDGELNLEHEINVDPYMFEFARRKQKNNNATEDTSYDNELMLLDLVRDGGGFTQRNKEGFTSVTLTASIDVFGNLRFTPARILNRWGDWLKQCIRYNTDKEVIYQRNDNLTDLKTSFGTETGTINECSNIIPDLLADSYLTGQIVNFSAAITQEEFFNIKNGKGKRIEYPNPINNKIEQGALLEVSINPVDRNTNFKLIQLTPNTDIVEYFVLGANEENAIIATNNDELIQLNN